MKLKIQNFKITPDKDESVLSEEVRKCYSITGPFELTIDRKSLDARQQNNIYYIYRFIIDVSEQEAARLLQYEDISEHQEKLFPGVMHRVKDLNVIIVGTGPAGLMSALRFIEAGARVELFEQGKPVEERLADIKQLEENGLLNTESNVLFGEGGAGTYSDGKLTTRTNRPEMAWVFQKLAEFGAPTSILYEAKPHLGTDRLSLIIKNIREHITRSGSTIRFNKKITDFIINENCVKGVITAAGKEYTSKIVMLATGHSSRDMYQLLYDKKIALEKKGFAIGVRVEHPAEYINSIRYGSSKYRNVLPAADYQAALNNKQTGRSVYTFCMCPGGVVVNSSSEENMLCVNGMSYSRRNAPYSNAAVVVSVKPEDLADSPLAGLVFQQEIERKAFLAAGGGYTAPVQTIEAFLQNDSNGDTQDVYSNASYRPGVAFARLQEYLPMWICNELKTGLNHFDKKLKGFTQKGLLIGPETRTSSPVRITRNDRYESVSHKGLYPVGEGAGYAGGIVSSAVDGVKAADSVLAQLHISFHS
ncbi:MAG: NAD(P)/FAD-dependent oxidoreductase [Desulfobacterales bacterium]|nr:NAD(P)/FAD-dependent oxidoreductase [Desulfobacterales bacterium]